jgi:glucosamine kinase
LELVLGADIGGTLTRAVVCTVDGAVVGAGRAGAGNPVTVAPETARANVAKALRAALSNVDSVGYAVIGAAGSDRKSVV